MFDIKINLAFFMGQNPKSGDQWGRQDGIPVGGFCVWECEPDVKQSGRNFMEKTMCICEQLNLDEAELNIQLNV